MALELPTIDLGSGEASRALDAAFRTLGFAQLTGHALDPDVAAELRQACDAFFAAPTEAKRSKIHPDPVANRGYRAKGAESLSYSLGEAAPPDLFESFNCASDDRVGDSPLLQATPWPHEVSPAFHSAAEAYLAEMQRISRTLDELVDEAIGTTLATQSSGGPDTMACIDYRPSEDGTEAAVDGQQRMGAHSDYTTFTLLNADPVPGLQIVADDRWADVVPTPGTLLVNVGDVLAMLTNDQWPSTLHRVIPMGAGAAPTRRSVAYFHYPDLDVSISPLGSFVTDERPARYDAVTVERHLASKLVAPKVHEPSTGASTAAGRPTS